MVRTSTSQTSPSEDTARCPACGQPLETLVRGRCPLCDYQVQEESITAPDTTLYGQAERPHRAEWWAMTRYMWLAGAGRLSHLSLMRNSRNARRFCRRTTYPLIVVSAICWLCLTGWHAVKPIPGQAADPSGRGWMRFASAPAPPIGVGTNPTRIVALWWNAPQALVGAIMVLVWSSVVALILWSILRSGVEVSLHSSHRGQQRLGAALCYSAAWSVPLIPAGLILALHSLSWMAEAGNWAIQPPAGLIYVPAAVVAAVAVFMGWFGLVRLASTLPVRSRTRVVLFVGLCYPLIVTVLIAGSIWGIRWMQGAVSTSLQLQW